MRRRSRDTKHLAHKNPVLLKQVCRIGEKRPLYKIVRFMRKWAFIFVHLRKKGHNFQSCLTTPSHLGWVFGTLGLAFGAYQHHIFQTVSMDHLKSNMQQDEADSLDYGQFCPKLKANCCEICKRFQATDCAPQQYRSCRWLCHHVSISNRIYLILIM